MTTQIDWSKSQFRKSTYSSNDDSNDCVEVAFAVTAEQAVVGVRDSKNRNSVAPVLEFPPASFGHFLAALGAPRAIEV